MSTAPDATAITTPKPSPEVSAPLVKRKTRSRKSYATADIATALEKRFPPTSHGVIYEVGNGTGMNCNRHADALVMSYWPSRGLTLDGFEFKASRSDWVKERNEPAKAESISRYCDRWWLAVTDESIVHAGELPEMWGMMALDGRGILRVVKEAPKLEPVAMDRSMLAAIFRRVAEPVANTNSGEIRREYDRGYKAGQESKEARLNRVQEELRDLRQSIAKFEHASGVSLNTWRYGVGSDQEKIGHAVKFVLDGGVAGQLQSLERVADTARQIETLVAKLKATFAVDSQLPKSS